MQLKAAVNIVFLFMTLNRYLLAGVTFCWFFWVVSVRKNSKIFMANCHAVLVFSGIAKFWIEIFVPLYWNFEQRSWQNIATSCFCYDLSACRILFLLNYGGKVHVFVSPISIRFLVDVYLMFVSDVVAWNLIPRRHLTVQSQQ